MKYLIAIIFLVGFVLIPAFGQEVKNPSLSIETIEIPSDEFNKILRDTTIVYMEKVHTISWQVTIDNNLQYNNPDGNGVLRLYDKVDLEKFIEVGMGSLPEYKFWVGVNIPDDEGYVIVHSDIERGWSPSSKTILTYTDRAGLTINNGARIVVSNLDIGLFAIGSYSVHGMEGSTDPPAVNSGSMIVEFISGDPAKNVFSFYPFALAVGIFSIVGILFLTKKRN